MKPVAIRWRRVALLTLVGVAAAYLIVLGAMFFLQRDLLYYPVAPGASPDPGGPSIAVVQIETEDGERLVGWWLPAEDDNPTILFFNGNAAGLAVQEGRWRRIADKGVGFLAIAYRGYDGSTGRPTEAGLHMDAAAAYDWLIRRVAPSRIVIHGFSLGSGVAVRLASERSARAVILEAPYTATVDVAAETYPWAPVSLLMLDQYRSRDIIDRVEEPVLVIHGDADEVIPFDQGWALYRMAGQPKAFVRMVGSNHSTLVRDGAYDHIWRFLNLPPGPPSAAEGHQARSATVAAGL
ncbi:MAG TPA: alpha/beta hydrolase [Caulobacteraceae bacterium]|nr:alpha/beta hydrolase [Caulobacteraceae bacterium]